MIIGQKIDIDDSEPTGFIVLLVYWCLLFSLHIERSRRNKQISCFQLRSITCHCVCGGIFIASKRGKENDKCVWPKAQRNAILPVTVSEHAFFLRSSIASAVNLAIWMD